LLVVSVAAYTGHLELGNGFRWMGTTAALVAFSTATVLEIAAYYIPWLDHLFDTIAGPAAVVAGSIVAASAFTEMDPLMRWSLAIIGGGGLAGLVKGTTAMTRGASTLVTGGLGNPILSTVEAGTSFILSVVAIVVPLLAMLAIVLIFLLAGKKLLRWLDRREAT